MVTKKHFCKGCGQRLAVKFLGKIVAHEFEDGFYCEYCGKIKVKKVREALE